MASSGTKTAVLVLVAAVAGAAGWWAWGEHQRRELRGTVGAFVQEASASLRDGLQATRASGDGAAGKLDADAKALEIRLAALERMNAARDRALVYAAEEYGFVARQVLRDLAQEQLRRRRVSERMQLLAQHMNRADRHAPDWHRNALRLKGDLEKSYFDYGAAAEALGRGLDAFPEVRARLALRLDPSLLMDEAAAADARRRAAEAARRVADEMQRARRMTGGR